MTNAMQRMRWMQWMADFWMEGSSASKWHDMEDLRLRIVDTAGGGGLAPVLVVVLAPGAALDLVPAIHAQGHAAAPTRVPVAVPGHAQTARALVGSLVPAANHHVKAKASRDPSQSEQGDGG